MRFCIRIADAKWRRLQSNVSRFLGGSMALDAGGRIRAGRSVGSHRERRRDWARYEG